MKSTITFMTTEDDKVNVIIEQEKVKHRNHGKSRVPYPKKKSQYIGTTVKLKMNETPMIEVTYIPLKNSKRSYRRMEGSKRKTRPRTDDEKADVLLELVSKTLRGRQKPCCLSKTNHRHRDQETNETPMTK